MPEVFFSGKTEYRLPRHFLRWIILLFVLLLGGWALWESTMGRTGTDSLQTQSVAAPPLPVVDPDQIVTLLPADSIRAIDDPQFDDAVSAVGSLDADEMVIGLVINAEARAYPIPILSVHEIVNDVVGGEPVAVTWCPLCYTALVFSRQVPDQPESLVFGVSGKLLDNTLVMFDRQSESLWSQLYAGALTGPFQGQSLEVFSSVLSTWSAWQAQHPETLVLSKNLTCEQFNCGSYSQNPRGSYDVDQYASYYNTPWEGIVNRQIPREEGAPQVKQRVLGVRVGSAVRAYPYAALDQQPLINDELGGMPLVVWFDPSTQSGSAYIRQAGGKTLTFQVDPDEPARLRDLETGTSWNRLDGQAVSGPLLGERLPQVFVTPAFDFGWFGYFPQSEVFRATEGLK